VSGERGNLAEKSENLAQVQQLVMELAKAYRAIELYPIGHPQLKNIIGYSFEKIVPELNRLSEAVFTVGKDGLYYQGRILESKIESLNQLANELLIRQVRKFAFRKGLTEQEFFDFIKMLLIPAEEFRAGKKIEDYFRKKRISSIWVNEVDFSKVFLGDGKAGALAEEEGEAEERVEEQSKNFEQIKDLVEGLDLAVRDDQAETVIEEMEKELAQLLAEKKFPEGWFLVGAVSDFYEQTNERFNQARGRASGILKKAGESGFLSWAVERFKYSNEDSGKAFERFFNQIGDFAVNAVLEKVLTPEPIYFQKQLINYLRSKGESVRALIEERLKGEPKAGAGKLIYLLGELRTPESAQLLLALARGSDSGLKLEAIRALSKIKAKAVNIGLAGLLRDKGLSDDAKLLIIQTLGERREEVAVPGLISILKKTTESMELREKSAEALGKIGSREALPCLIEAITKRGIFQKPAPERVRMKCAEALARLGGERAEAVLKELASGEGLLARSALELLKQAQAQKRR